MHASISAETRLRLAFWALAAIALLISHDATYLVQMGPGEMLTRALREAGHGYWGAASAMLLVAGILAGVWVGLRIVRLRRHARAVGVRVDSVPPASWIRRAGAMWGRLAIIVAAGFLVQENVEHLLTHGHAPGVGALAGPESPLALPVIAGITLLAAVVATALRVTERRLVAAILHALRSNLGRAPRALPRPEGHVLVQSGSPIARAAAGRAPPALLPVTA